MLCDDLIEIANELAVREKGKPKEASLRRAVSTAYYAIFHRLAELCAQALVGRSHPWNAFTPIYRSLDHNATRKIFENDRKPMTFGANAVAAGQIFVALQGARQLADYDPQFPYGRSETIELLDRAKEAIAFIDAMSKPEKLRLAAALVAKKR